jgi:hypothetical protein
VADHACQLKRLEVAANHVSSPTFRTLVEGIAIFRQRPFTLVYPTKQRLYLSNKVWLMALMADGFIVPVIIHPTSLRSSPKVKPPNFKPCFVSFLSHHRPQALTHSRRSTACSPVESITSVNEFTSWRPSEHTMLVSSIASHRQISRENRPPLVNANRFPTPRQRRS